MPVAPTLEDIATAREALAQADPALPDLGVVLATFKTWKAARRQAAVPVPVEADDVPDFAVEA